MSESTADRHEDLIDDLATGRRGFREIPRDLPATTAAEIRRRALERRRGTVLEHVGRFTLDAAEAASRHCENFIGATQVPLGIVGPLRVRGEETDSEEELFVPLATTEGALIASTNRGCRAIAQAGGAVARIEDVGMTRAPVFRSSGVEETRRFLAWVGEHEEEIRRSAEASSRFLKLVEIRPQAMGTSVYLRFRFETGDAMGMNMVTIACDKAIREVIEPGTGVPCVALSGNYCVDKKPSAVNFIEGRGKRILAEVTLDAEILRGTLKTTAETLVEVQYRKNLLGSVVAGAMGSNAHFANTLAAFFLATGQDIAQVVEGSMGVTCIERRGESGVYASVFLPDVPLGAVGGGTRLATQSEALELLGVAPDPERPGRAAIRLAEILGATVLAGELSLLAAFTSRDLARAHEMLGRGPVPAASGS